LASHSEKSSSMLCSIHSLLRRQDVTGGRQPD
jgi:hypothetical protein